MKEESIYSIYPLQGTIAIDGNWDKSPWTGIKAVEMSHFMGQEPEFSPTTYAKLTYDKDYIYGIFQVHDQYVQCLVQDINGPVSTDSCVEFFFSPDSSKPLNYFNLEINCSGVPLLHYVTQPRKEYLVIDEDNIKKIEIAHSMPGKVEPEIAEPTVWTIEFKVPLEMLENFSNVTRPEPGVIWKANFYKTGSRTSNPHYFTWSLVDNPRPDFHLPQFFGTLVFK